jgi:hypothetical protein
MPEKSANELKEEPNERHDRSLNVSLCGDRRGHFASEKTDRFRDPLQNSE